MIVIKLFINLVKKTETSIMNISLTPIMRAITIKERKLLQ